MIKLGNVFILGDSYSTFEDEIPVGYDTWYYHAMSNPTDVATADQTWWKQLLACTESQLVRNESWSGTPICHKCHNEDRSNRSFVTRFDKLAADGFFEQHTIDTVFVFGGTNDLCGNSVLGELQYENWKTEDLYAFFPAVCYLMHRIKETLPQTRTIFIVSSWFNTQMREGIYAACERFGAEVVQLEEFSTQGGHPNQQGMTQIKDQVLSYLEHSIGRE